MRFNVAQPFGITLSLLPELTLTAFALLALLVVAWRHRTAADSRLAGWVSFAGLLVATAAVAWLWQIHARPFGPARMVALDEFRLAAAIIILLSAMGTILLSLVYLEREGLLAPEYYVLVLFAAIGMLFLAGAEDMIVLFLGLEVMSVAVYVLAGYDRRNVFSAEAALKYFLIGAFASAFLLYGIALVYGATGTTSLTAAGAMFSRGSLPLMGSLGLGFLLIGFGFKVAGAPFHMWTPDVYDGAPTPVTGFMATGVKVAAFASLARVLAISFGTARTTWVPIVTVLAVLSMAIGNLVALNQRSIKRMLAYSSIAHAGYLLAALLPGTEFGASATIVYLFAYATTSLATFGLLAVLGRNGERDVTLDSLAGLAQRRPWLGAALTICMLSLLGFPGTVGFIGKWLIILALLGQEQYVVAVALVLATLVSAGYYLPVIMTTYMRPAESEESHRMVVVGRAAGWTIAAAVVAVVVLGLWPTPALEAAQYSAASLYEPRPVDLRHAIIRP